jgi:hypothetical protein
MIKTTLAMLMIATAAHTQTESEYRDMLCGGKGWEMETRLANGTRVDCLTDRLAIEVEFAAKWHEAIGQSLNYAAVTGKQPAVILICKRGTEAKCLNWSLLLAETAEYWKLPITVWQCGAEVESIEDCRRRDFGGAN